VAAAAMIRPQSVEQVSADLAVAEAELSRLQAEVAEAEAEFARSGSSRWQLKRDQLRRVLERGEVGHRHLIDRLAEAKQLALHNRVADLLQEEAELKARWAAAAELFKSEFLAARSRLLELAQMRTESRDLAVKIYFADGELQGERRVPQMAWNCLSLPSELGQWTAEFSELVEQSSRGWTP
jgi:hypothetical protein